MERQYENRILIQGSQKGIGPKCYYANDFYRIEEDIADARHPSNQELQQQGLLTKIVEKISEFHKLKLDAIENIAIFCLCILSSEYIDKAKKSILTKEFTPEEQVIVDRITAYFEE
mgnify:CR=1 FL=1